MSALRNGAMNGTNGAASAPVSKRFSDIPAAIDVPVQGEAEDEAVEIDLLELFDDPTELCTLFENERAARTYWMTVALAYAKQKKIDHAIEMLVRGGNAMRDNNPREKLSMIGCLCWMYLWKSREAPRVPPDGELASEAKTKEYYLQLATSTLNDASRINPAFPPLFLARGVLQLLRASLQTPKATGHGQVDSEKADLLRSALKAFEDAIRVSQGKNMLAVMGKARTFFSLGKYPESLACYQEVLQKMPDFVDPDPRIGIGCCFWQLGFKDDAKLAWERCLEINPDHKVGNILLGLYYLDASGHIPTNSPDFLRLYKKAMTEYTQKSFKLDKNMPLTCATFAGYFLSRKQLSTVDSLAHKAIQYTDVNAIASDGWYLLARKEHYTGDPDRASDFYRRADDARGGAERGYLPAKFGAAQLAVLRGDLGEAKLRLEKMIQQSKNHEAMILLGTLYAEEVFANEEADGKEDKSAEMKKAISLLEGVRGAWKDSKKGMSPDAAVLLNLARLYEHEFPERAQQCLLQVEQLELEQIPEDDYPTEITDETEKRAALRKFLPPQLLNNIGCFYSQSEKHEQASEMFEAALGACMKIGEKDQEIDTDALVTTISFNLGRSYESQGLYDKSIEVYEGLLKRHDDYTDARTRLAYIKLRKNPNKEGPDAVSKLYQENPQDLEVRALYGWYMGKVHSRKRPQNINEDHEFRHYKHTLQNYDKHDRYALVGMGNLYLIQAREMRRENDGDKAKRSATYSKAVEFFEKALSLDPKNAYAAQGIAIALVEDKKDYKTALGIFVKIRDTIKDAHVYVNLGHIYAELRQYSKAIENYEVALSKEGKATDPVILACLGRTWLNKGRSEKLLDAYHEALKYAQKALEAAPEQVHYKFNVAFVQIQMATTVYGLNENQRTLAQLQEAATGLESAISALDEIASHPQTPYPKHDVEQRANMARNTQRKQLERAIASQKEYEEKNKEKLQAALEQRQAELRKREEERQKALEKERERQEKIRKEREEIAARDREIAERRAEEDKARQEAEMTTDSETGDKVKRKKKSAPRGDGESRPKKGSRKKKADTDADDSAEERPTKKKRRLTKKESTTNSKYKSAEIIVDSDEDEDEDEDPLDRAERALEKASSPLSDAEEKQGDVDDKMEVDNGRGDDEDEDEDTGVSRRQQSSRSRRGRVIESDEEEDDDEAPAKNGAGADSADEDDKARPAADTSMADADDDDEE
ncbi:RNA polymerase II transcription elongation factor [Colletotrichum tofieldiae]|nr:RNA polymerase II transcription elongation factor [Colletotrichum tofieldiae]GKT73648.1 RNA polymerase II transcription elongation factor [Colletotrichum tofieldiae]GKT95599.1 RNA polymerase II transcription elongation factor [Colletotrichum tofieldiae]